MGKSTAGAGAAVRLGRPFLDLDAEIERREGMTVARIFAQQGEPRFRELERALTLELAGQPPAVVAPGGGWVMNAGVVALVRPPSAIIYLRAGVETILRRLGTDRRSRPLLDHPDPRGTLEHLLATRGSAYESADHVIDTDLLDIQQLIDEIAKVALASGGG